LDTLVACLTLSSPPSAPVFGEAVRAAVAAGGLPFEAIAGTPASRYGARLSFRPAHDRRALAEAFGLEAHPWGLPDWIGVRVRSEGTVSTKAYHRLVHLGPDVCVSGRFRFAGHDLPLPEALPPGLRPIMASQDAEDVELYLRLADARSWTSFVGRCTEAFGGLTYPFSPTPRPVEEAFCVSLRWLGGNLSAVTMYADERALPPDTDIPEAWTTGMDERERAAYEAALVGVRSLGSSRGRGWHAMLGWTVEEDDTWHRAASLRVHA
jgi:hypothetical protein